MNNEYMLENSKGAWQGAVYLESPRRLLRHNLKQRLLPTFGTGRVALEGRLLVNTFGQSTRDYPRLAVDTDGYGCRGWLGIQ